MIDLVIRNGEVVLPGGVKQTSILVNRGQIVGLTSEDFLPEAGQTVDATGKYVLPGLIDNHVHFNLPFMGTTTRDDFYTGTRAAAFGGVTTVIDFAIQKKGGSLVEAVENKRAEGKGMAVVDFAVHPTPTDVTSESLSEMRQVIDDGSPSFKVFMTYRKQGIMLDDAAVLKVLRETKLNGGLVGAHTENDSIAVDNTTELLAQGKNSHKYFPVSKPALVEAECINRVLFLAQWEQAPFFDFHMTIKEGVDMLRHKKGQGLPVYAETCTHYLILTDEVYERSDGHRFACSPPIRKKADTEALWQGLSDGTLSIVSSDQCGFDSRQKEMGKDSFDRIPNGLPGHEARLPILYSEGVSQGRISVNRLAEITSTNAAKLFGLYPQKGIIAVGSDADLVVLDPTVEWTISHRNLHIDVDWSPFEGMKVRGRPVATISRGRIVTQGDEFKGEKGWGQFLKRRIEPPILKSASVW